MISIRKYTHIKKLRVLNKEVIFSVAPTFLELSQGSIRNHILKQMLFSEL